VVSSRRFWLPPFAPKTLSPLNMRERTKIVLRRKEGAQFFFG
jgi:hypothetical protein